MFGCLEPPPNEPARRRSVHERRLDPQAFKPRIAPCRGPRGQGRRAYRRADDHIASLTEKAEQMATHCAPVTALTGKRLPFEATFGPEWRDCEGAKFRHTTHRRRGRVEDNPLEARHPNAGRCPSAGDLEAGRTTQPGRREHDRGPRHGQHGGRPTWGTRDAVEFECERQAAAVELHADSGRSKDARAAAISSRTSSRPLLRAPSSRSVGSAASRGSTPSLRSFRLAPAIV